MAKSRHYNSDNCYIIPLIRDAEREAIVLKDDLVSTYHVLIALLKTDDVEDFFEYYRHNCTLMLNDIYKIHIKIGSPSYNDLLFSRMTVSPDIMRLVDIAYDKAKCESPLEPINNLYFLYACLASYSPESVHLIGAWPNIQQDILTYLEIDSYKEIREPGIIHNLESLEMNKIEQEEPLVCEENIASSDVISEEFESFLNEDNAQNLWTEIVILELKKEKSYYTMAIEVANAVVDAYREKFKK